MTNEDRLAIIKDFLDWEYVDVTNSWDHIMAAWHKLTYLVWIFNKQSYATWFQHYIHSWKTNCFNASQDDAFCTLVDAIKEFQATHIIPCPPTNPTEKY